MFYNLGARATIDEVLKLGNKIKWAENEVNSSFEDSVSCSAKTYNFTGNMIFKVDIDRRDESQEPQRLEEAIAEYFIFAGTPSFVTGNYKPIENALKPYSLVLKKRFFDSITNMGYFEGKHVVDK